MPPTRATTEERSAVRTLLRLWPYVRPVRVRLFSAALVAIVASCTGLVIPLVLKWMVDGPVADRDPGGVWLGALYLRYRLPSIWGGGGYLDAGGLLSYQGDWPWLYRRAAALVDKILKGARPGDIPFEQGTKLELVVSLKGARALGISIPRSVLVAADELIE